MDFQSFKAAVIAKCAQMGIADYELYYHISSGTSVDIFMHEVNGFTSSKDGGVCLRCIVGGKMGYASTQALSEAEANALVERAADNAATLESDDEVFLGEGGQEYIPLERAPYALASTEELISTALAAQEKLYAANPAVIDGCQTQGVLQSGEIAIYNSRGLDLHYTNNLSGIISVAVVTNGKEMENSFDLKLGKLDTIDTDALTRKTVDSALRKLGGDVAPTGKYSVVFNPEAMASLLQVYSSVFSSENAQKGLSKLAGKEGEVIAAPIVNIIDDPFYKDSPEPINFDDEGSPAHTKAVVENGALKTLLYNLKTAHKAGKKTTGNGSKAGYDAPIGISPFTFYLAGSEMTEQELLQKVGSGVYINSLAGLHAGADAISGDFSLQSSGFMIENGEKAGYVKSFTVAGNFYDLLKNITAVANNVALPMAMGQTNFGAPSTWVEGLSIAGK